MSDKVIGTAQIRKNAVVWQDFRGKRWPADFGVTDANMVFNVVKTNNGVALRAFGFGDLSKPGGYGNGRIFTTQEQIKKFNPNRPNGRK